MESIEVKNFGPIKHVKLDLKDINVFIGTTGSGKSTVAKLVAIFRTFVSVQKSDDEYFNQLLIKYNIEYQITNKTYIRYEYRGSTTYWELKDKSIETTLNIVEEDLFVESFFLLLPYLTMKDYANEGGFKQLIKKLEDLSYSYTTIFHSEPKIGRNVTKPSADFIYKLKNFKTEVEKYHKEEGKNLPSVRHFIEHISDFHTFTQNESFTSKCVYIPAERSLLSTVGDSIFSLISN